MTKSMLIDAAHLEETRILILEDKKIEDLDFESSTKEQLRGNIYLAKVSRVEPSLRAAFVDYGNDRHGFLPFNEIHPDYFQIPIADKQELLANTIDKVLKPKGVAVVIDSNHNCMSTRGVHKTHSSTITSRMLGIFRTDNKAREEFINLINSPQKF